MTGLYAFGSNGNGQLGIGHLNDVTTPKPCLGLPDTDLTIKKISGGGNHSAILTTTGQLYMSGYSQAGESCMNSMLESQQQQPESDYSSWTRFEQRYSHQSWKDVACGWAFTILLEETTGKVFGIGTSNWNELAGHTSTDKLVEIEGVKDITAIATGWRHVVVLNGKGEVFGWGWGYRGQLGPSPAAVAPLLLPSKNKKDIRSIQKIDIPQEIVQIACGHLHTLLRGKDGTVYAFGSNKFGQLGNVDQDHVVHLDHKSVFIDAGWHHNVSLDKEGKLLLWGRDDRGQLGAGSLLDVKQVACGSEHTLVIDKHDKASAWGWNEHGNCAASNKDYTSEPVLLDHKFSPVKTVGAGCATSWIGL